MTTLGIIVDVMFAIYAINFITGFLNGFTRHWNYGAKMWVDLILGFLLLMLVLAYGQPIASY